MYKVPLRGFAGRRELAAIERLMQRRTPCKEPLDKTAGDYMGIESRLQCCSISMLLHKPTRCPGATLISSIRADRSIQMSNHSRGPFCLSVQIVLPRSDCFA
jgi:hypothetical protein